ncbi:MAG: hypothetical protein HQL69_03190 [Magnetococcales bacterium]|nr:hypothetical protein [Magnetococcales bacterium]
MSLKWHDKIMMAIGCEKPNHPTETTRKDDSSSTTSSPNLHDAAPILRDSALKIRKASLNLLKTPRSPQKETPTLVDYYREIARSRLKLQMLGEEARINNLRLCAAYQGLMKSIDRFKKLQRKPQNKVTTISLPLSQHNIHNIGHRQI